MKIVEALCKQLLRLRQELQLQMVRMVWICMLLPLAYYQSIILEKRMHRSKNGFLWSLPDILWNRIGSTPINHCILDFSEIKTVLELHQYLKEMSDLPAYYGNNKVYTNNKIDKVRKNLVDFFFFPIIVSLCSSCPFWKKSNKKKVDEIIKKEESRMKAIL